MNQATTKNYTGIKWTRCNGFRLHDSHGGNVVSVDNYGSPERSNRDQRSENFFLNSYQYFLYRRCLFGLDVYPKEEIELMGKFIKGRIMRIHYKSLEVLNLFRQRVLIAITDKLVRDMFSQWTRAEFLLGRTEPHPKFKCELSFSSLGITREKIARELVDKTCLPSDFYSLTVLDDPRAKMLINAKESLNSY